MMVQANYKIMKEKRTILLSGRDSSSKQDWQLSVWRFTNPPMPSGIAKGQKFHQAEIRHRTDEFEMVQATLKVKNEKTRALLTLWQGLDLGFGDVKFGQSFAIAEPFGHCDK